MGHSIKSREIIKRLKRDGWRLARVTGDHHTFVKEGVEHLVTVPHPKRDLPIGTLRAIFRTAGWSWPPR